MSKVSATHDLSGVIPESRKAWIIVVLLTAAGTLAYMDRQVLNLLVGPIKEDLLLSDIHISILQGLAFSLFYGALGIPLARIADGTSRKKVILFGIVAWSVMATLSGMAKSFWQLFICRSGIAIGEAGLSPSVSSILADTFPKEKLSVPIAIYTSGTYIGGGFALIVGGWINKVATSVSGGGQSLFGDLAPWRVTFFLLGALGIPMVLLIAAGLSEPKRREYSAQKKRHAEIFRQSIPLRVIMQFLADHRHFLGAHFIGFATVLAYISAVIAWVPTLLIRIHGMPIEKVGSLYGVIFAVCGVSGALLGGWLSDFLTVRGRKTAPMDVSLLSIFGLLASGLGSGFAPDSLSALIWSGACIFFLAPLIALPPVMLQIIAPNRMRAQLAAIFILFTGITGISFGPLVVAMFTDLVFNNDMMLGYSLALAAIVLCGTATPILLYARSQYGKLNI